MDVLNYVEDKDVEKPKYIKEMGEFNDMPTPFKKVDIDEVFHKLTTYSPKFEDFRQVHDKKLNLHGNSTHIFFFHDEAYAIMREDKGYSAYRIGCEHDMDSVKIGNCLHKYTCKKCGLVEEIDSSD